MSDHNIPVHAYVFMGNRIHLLVTPPQRQLLSRAMRHLGQCYVRAFNLKHRRTGTLWQGRFKACPVDSETYLMTAYRYIELNPVRAAMVEHPELHPWSSIHANVGLERTLGDPKFQVMVQKALGRHASVRSPGRPKRVADDS